MGSTETSTSSFGAVALAGLMRPGARAAGLIVYGSVNLVFSPDRLIRSDVTVLHRVPDDEGSGRWVPAGYATMPVVFLTPPRDREGRADVEALCAGAGIRYLMWVEIMPRLRHAAVALHRLGDDGRYAPFDDAIIGETLMVEEPFRMAFDPELLLSP